jgi:hypothetical protein
MTVGVVLVSDPGSVSRNPIGSSAIIEFISLIPHEEAKK